MLEPYANIRDRHAHGDVIVWPLKALCDYLEATNDLAFLDEPVAWRREGDFARTAAARSGDGACGEAPRHRARALHPGHAPHPLRRGRLERQPAAGRPAHARLDGEQLDGRAPVPAAQALRRGDAPRGTRRARRRSSTRLAAAMGADFNRHLVRDGIVAGYAHLRAGGGRAGASASPERPAHGAPLFAAADDPQHHRRALHARAGASTISPSSGNICSFPTACG